MSPEDRAIEEEKYKIGASGFKRSIKNAFEEMQEIYGSKVQEEGKTVHDVVWPQIKDIIIKTLILIQP